MNPALVFICECFCIVTIVAASLLVSKILYSTLNCNKFFDAALQDLKMKYGAKSLQVQAAISVLEKFIPEVGWSRRNYIEQ